MPVLPCCILCIQSMTDRVTLWQECIYIIGGVLYINMLYNSDFMLFCGFMKAIVSFACTATLYLLCSINDRQRHSLARMYIYNSSSSAAVAARLQGTVHRMRPLCLAYCKESCIMVKYIAMLPSTASRADAVLALLHLCLQLYQIRQQRLPQLPLPIRRQHPHRGRPR